MNQKICNEIKQLYNVNTNLHSCNKSLYNDDTFIKLLWESLDCLIFTKLQMID